jgi:hypothetical protein
MSRLDAADDEASRDAQLALELTALRREREDIISGASIAGPDLDRVSVAFKRKLQATADAREYQMANLRLHFELEKKLALDEMLAAKGRLRDQIIVTHGERKKKFDAIKVGGGASWFRMLQFFPLHNAARFAVTLTISTLFPAPMSYSFRNGTVAKRRKRAAKGAAAASAAAAAAAAVSLAAGPRYGHGSLRPQLAASLEAQGLVRVKLAPDEMNRDVALILQRMDAARHAGTAGGTGAGGVGALSAGVGAIGAVAARKKTEAIHSSRGILHFHSEVFEKGESVVAYAPGSLHPPKYSGIIMSINSKEIQVRAHTNGSDGKPETNRVYVSHLRKDTIRIKHAPPPA